MEAIIEQIDETQRPAHVVEFEATLGRLLADYTQARRVLREFLGTHPEARSALTTLNLDD